MDSAQLEVQIMVRKDCQRVLFITPSLPLCLPPELPLCRVHQEEVIVDKRKYSSLHQEEPEPESPQTEEQPEDVSSSELRLKSEVLQDPEGKTSGPTFHLFSDSDLSSHTSLEKARVSRFVGGGEGDCAKHIFSALSHLLYQAHGSFLLCVDCTDLFCSEIQ